METFDLVEDVRQHPYEYYLMLTDRPNPDFLTTPDRKMIKENIIKEKYLIYNMQKCIIQEILFDLGYYKLCYESSLTNFCPGKPFDQDERLMTDEERMYYLMLRLRNTGDPMFLFDIVEIPNFYFTYPDILIDNLNGLDAYQQMDLLEKIFKHTSYEEFLYNVLCLVEDLNVVEWILPTLPPTLKDRYLHHLLAYSTTYDEVYSAELLDIIINNISDMNITIENLNMLLNSVAPYYLLRKIPKTQLQHVAELILSDGRYDLVQYLPNDIKQVIKKNYNLGGENGLAMLQLEREIRETTGLRQIAQDIDQTKGTLTTEARMLLEIQNLISSSQQSEMEKMYAVSVETEKCMEEYTKLFNKLMGQINKTNVIPIIMNLAYPDEYPVYRKIPLEFMHDIWCNEQFTETLRNRFYLQIMTKYIKVVTLSEARPVLLHIFTRLGRHWYYGLSRGFGSIIYASELKQFERIANHFLIVNRLG